MHPVGGFFFFFQAEDGIRAATVTGVQTCALPISGQEVGGAAWWDPSCVTPWTCSCADRQAPCACASKARADGPDVLPVGSESLPNSSSWVCGRGRRSSSSKPLLLAM